MPTNEVERVAWWNVVNPDRLNKREYGTLKGKALKKAQRLVNSLGSIFTSGEYGSISISEKDYA